MENKKLKLTISGKPKKSFKNFETSKSQGKHSVIIEKTQNKFQLKIDELEEAGLIMMLDDGTIISTRGY